MSYRADFIISTIGMICTNVAGFISFWILFRNFPSVNGWNYYEMLFLYGFSLIALTPVQCLFDNNWSLRIYVYSGDFIKYCFRPINLFFYYQSEVFDIKGLGQLAFGIGTLAYAWTKIGLGFTPFILLKVVVFLLTASLIMIAMQNAAAATCFWIQNSFYVLDLVTRFKDYAKYPITIFTTRETVDKVEKMKVCTCLNPLHTALAVFGCLMGYTLISEEMKNPSLKKLVEQIGYTEGLPVVVNPGILDPKEFLDTVLNVRIPNPFMPDTPQRIATDTSQKLAIRFGETIKAYAADPKLNVRDLKFIPLVFAGWLRYLMGVDDNGKAFTLSSDPRLQELTAIVSGISLGASTDVEAVLDNVLSDASIWGVDLKALGMDTIVCRYFQELIAGPGAVAVVLSKYTS